MSNLTRTTQQIFAQNAGFEQIAQIGSLAASAPVYTTNLSTIQALSNYLDGLYSIVVGENSPAIQDFNAFFFLITSQLAYIFQKGVPEWDAGTTYYTNSMVQDGSGNIYISLTNSNLNNALTDGTNWTYFQGLTTNTFPGGAVTVLSGMTRLYPSLDIASGKTWTVASGGTLVTIGKTTFEGTLVLNGDWIAL